MRSVLCDARGRGEECRSESRTDPVRSQKSHTCAFLRTSHCLPLAAQIHYGPGRRSSRRATPESVHLQVSLSSCKSPPCNTQSVCRDRVLLIRDLKPENILVDTDGYIKLCQSLCRYLPRPNVVATMNSKAADLASLLVVILGDFGASFKLVSPNEKTKTVTGTPDYMAPEMIRNQGHNRAVDYWAMGCLLYDMICRESPF